MYFLPPARPAHSPARLQNSAALRDADQFTGVAQEIARLRVGPGGDVMRLAGGWCQSVRRRGLRSNAANPPAALLHHLPCMCPCLHPIPCLYLQASQVVLAQAKTEARNASKELQENVVWKEGWIATRLQKAEKENSTVYLQVGAWGLGCVGAGGVSVYGAVGGRVGGSGANRSWEGQPALSPSPLLPLPICPCHPPTHPPTPCPSVLPLPAAGAL